tara:strand:+ start:198 stop:644 length:447 start_codon:yes stop_codon:yes gene_type:complete
MSDYNQSETTKKSELKCCRLIKKLCKNIFNDYRIKVHISTQTGAKVDMIVYNSENSKSFVVETKELIKNIPTYISTKKIYNIRKDYYNNGLIILIHKNIIYWADVSKIELKNEFIFDKDGDPCYIFQNNLSTNLDDLDSYLRLKLIVL